VAITTVHEVVVRNNNTDILFVVDDSGSMREEQINLIKNTGVFIEEVSKSENAYRVGVITTNANDEDGNAQIPDALGTDGGRLRMRRATNIELTAANPDFGLGEDLGLNIPCANTTRDTRYADEFYLVRPDLDSANLEAERCHLIKDFMATVASLGIAGTGREAGLQAVKKALQPTDANVVTRNEGFIRGDADLALVFLTDEDDCSFADYCAHTTDPDCRWANEVCYEQIRNAVPAQDYVDFLSAYKRENAGIRNVRAALIAAGTVAGDEAGSFEVRGCRITGGQPSTTCGCWTSTDSDYFCGYLHDQFSHPCSEEGMTGCTVDPGNGTHCKANPAGSCDTLRCEALPPKRYDEFIDLLGVARLDVGFPRGTFEDTICQPNYQNTLLSIARTVVLSSCFTLEEPVLDPKQVYMELRHTDLIDGTVTTRMLPRFDDTDTNADCNDCSDAVCVDGAWRLENDKEICLACNLKKDTGDDFVLTILNEVIGFDGGPGGDP